MHINHVGIESAIERLTALAWVESKPATRLDIGAFFKADRHIHPVAGAIAQGKVSAGRYGQRN